VNAVTKVAIADDHEAIRKGIRTALEPLTDFQVVGEAGDGAEALRLIEQFRPSILILDIALPDIGGIELARLIRRASPETRIIVYTMYADPSFFLNMFRAGVSGYVVKDDPLEDLLSALRAVRDGEAFFSGKVAPLIRDHIRKLERGGKVADGLPALSQRERRVFLLLAEGRSVKEIAFELALSPKTVETYKYRLMGKLGARSVVELTRIAIKGKLLEP
jgi:DNA-binding NarL/FixJ family response regulator